MKRLVLALAAGVALSWAAAGLWAQEEPAPPKPKAEKPEKERPKPKEPILRGTHAQMAKLCQLSEDQQKKIAELEKQRAADLKELQEKVKAAKDAQAEARKGQDKEALKKANDAFREANEEVQKATRKWWMEILGVLTPEQKAKWYEYVVMQQIQARFKSAKLTQEQLDKIKAAYVEQTTGVDLAEDKARAQAMAKLSAYVMQDVLTGEQRADMYVESARQQYRKVKITDEQLGKIGALYAEATKGVSPADEKAWAEAMRKVSEQTLSQVLTEEQREAVKPKPRPAAEGEKSPAPAPKKAPAKPAPPVEVPAEG